MLKLFSLRTKFQRPRPCDSRGFWNKKERKSLEDHIVLSLSQCFVRRNFVIVFDVLLNLQMNPSVWNSQFFLPFENVMFSVSVVFVVENFFKWKKMKFSGIIFFCYFFSNPDNLQCTSSSTPLVDNFFLNSLITFIFFHHVLPFSLFFSFDCSMDHIDVVLLVCLRSEFFFLEIFLLDRFSNAWTKALWNRFNQADPSTYRRSSTSTSTASLALFSFVFPSAHYSVFRNFHHRKNRDIERERVGRKKIIK